jgi:nitrogen PTS system EIIA component
MSDVMDIIFPEIILCDLAVKSKAEVLVALAQHLSQACGHDATTIYHALVERERLGSTGVGHGVAIPHARIANLERTVAVFARLKRPVDFEAIDLQPVDLMFSLLSPEAAGADHLKALSRIARLLHTPDLCRRLRRAASASELHSLLHEYLSA